MGKCPVCQGPMRVQMHRNGQEEWGWWWNQTNLCSYTCMRKMEKGEANMSREWQERKERDKVQHKDYYQAHKDELLAKRRIGNKKRASA